MRLHHVQGACPPRKAHSSFPGSERLHAFDAHGNRVELLAWVYTYP